MHIPTQSVIRLAGSHTTSCAHPQHTSTVCVFQGLLPCCYHYFVVSVGGFCPLIVPSCKRPTGALNIRKRTQRRDAGCTTQLCCWHQLATGARCAETRLHMTDSIYEYFGECLCTGHGHCSECHTAGTPTAALLLSYHHVITCHCPLKHRKMRLRVMLGAGMLQGHCCT